MHAFRAWLAPINVTLTGMHFGVLQWGAFFLLQSYVASTATVYLLATVAWMVGSLAGLALPGRSRELLWLGLSAAAYTVLYLLASSQPYELRWLPVLLACVAVMGGYAGRFFRFRAVARGGNRRLFLLENTGFVAGMALTVGLLCWIGDAALRFGPALGAGLCALTAWPLPGPDQRRLATPGVRC